MVRDVALVTIGPSSLGDGLLVFLFVQGLDVDQQVMDPIGITCLHGSHSLTLSDVCPVEGIQAHQLVDLSHHIGLVVLTHSQLVDGIGILHELEASTFAIHEVSQLLSLLKDVLPILTGEGFHDLGFPCLDPTIQKGLVVEHVKGIIRVRQIEQGCKISLAQNPMESLPLRSIRVSGELVLKDHREFFPVSLTSGLDDVCHLVQHLDGVRVDSISTDDLCNQLSDEDGTIEHTIHVGGSLGTFASLSRGVGIHECSGQSHRTRDHFEDPVGL